MTREALDVFGEYNQEDDSSDDESRRDAITAAVSVLSEGLSEDGGVRLQAREE